MAPENFQFDLDTKDSRFIQITTKADIWSLTCIISEILTNTIPWHSTKSEDAVGYNLSSLKKFPIPELAKKNIDVFSLISQGTDNDPSKRPSAFAIKEMLENILEKYYSNLT